MRDGYVLKSGETGEPGPQELALINAYTRRPFEAGEIYAFSVVLCDNEIDRDCERFTVDALQKLSRLFVGKTGIFDHSMKSENQTARIFSARVETDETRRTRAGEPYCRLIARAYLPRTAKNADLILELESGIKKEVSVGCAVGSVTCSVCGADLKKGGCGHVKGRAYGERGREKICCAVLDEPTDAYEWSFVAVPAQREAGVVKAFAPERKGEPDMEELKKAIGGQGGEVVLSKDEAEKLLRRVEELEEQAEYGKRCREQLCGNVVRLCALAQPQLPAQAMRRAAERMTLEDLQAFEKAFQSRVDELLPARPQLAARKKPPEGPGNAPFRI